MTGPFRGSVPEPLPDMDAVREELIGIRKEMGVKTLGDDCAAMLLGAFSLREQERQAGSVGEGRPQTRWYFRRGELMALAERMRALGRGA